MFFFIYLCVINNLIIIYVPKSFQLLVYQFKNNLVNIFDLNLLQKYKIHCIQFVTRV